MTDREPIVTPGQMMAPPPTHTSDPIVIGLPASRVRRSVGVHRVRRRVDLHRRSEQREIADANGAHVEHHAIEIEEALRAEKDVRAVVAEKWRLHPHVVTAGAEQRAQNAAALLRSAPRVWRSSPGTDREHGCGLRPAPDRAGRRTPPPASSLFRMYERPVTSNRATSRSIGAWHTSYRRQRRCGRASPDTFDLLCLLRSVNMLPSGPVLRLRSRNLASPPGRALRPKSRSFVAGSWLA